MTHIIPCNEIPVHENHQLIKKAIQKGDKVVFQTMTELFDKVEEKEVVVTNVQTEPGLMKGWCIISWASPALVAKPMVSTEGATKTA